MHSYSSGVAPNWWTTRGSSTANPLTVSRVQKTVDITVAMCLPLKIVPFLSSRVASSEGVAILCGRYRPVKEHIVHLHNT